MAGIATRQLIQFQIAVDPELTAATFNEIEVHRSRVSEAGPYEELTAPGWETASIAVPAKAANINGVTLLLRVAETTDLPITFSGANPLTATSIAAQIETQGLGFLFCSVQGADLVLSTAQPGAAAVVRILASDGAALLGFDIEEPGSLGFGHDARIPIVPDRQSYSFTDAHGSSDYFYKVRFRNNLNQVSELSSAFSAGDVLRIPDNELALGYVDLRDVSGHPVVKREILISSTGYPREGQLRISNHSSIRTDSDGYAEMSFIRGSHITVAVAGTNIVRDVVVPTSPEVETFDLLGADVGSDDVFNVQRPNIDFAVRRTL